jgi:hypothetical protein
VVRYYLHLEIRWEQTAVAYFKANHLLSSVLYTEGSGRPTLGFCGPRLNITTSNGPILLLHRQSYNYCIRYPDTSVKHGSIRAFTPIAVTLCTDVFVYKTVRCSKTVLRNKVLHAICNILLV